MSAKHHEGYRVGDERRHKPAAREEDPGRSIALIALDARPPTTPQMLENVIRHAFDQLCWHRTTPQLEAFVEGLRNIMDEDT